MEVSLSLTPRTLLGEFVLVSSVHREGTSLLPLLGRSLDTVRGNECLP